MRVGIVSHSFYPKRGGAELHHLFLAAALSEFADVRVFTSASSLETREACEVVQQVTVLGKSVKLRISYLPYIRVLGENATSPLELTAALANFDPDLVWTNSPSISSDFAAAYAWSHRIPWFTTYHGDLDAASWSRRAYTGFEAVIERKAAAVLVHSERYARKLAGRGVARDRVHVVPPGPYIGNGLPPVPPVEARRLGPLEGSFLFVGVMDEAHQYKNAEGLIEALALLRKQGAIVRARFVGEGSRRKRLETMTNDLDCSGNVSFLGQLDDAQLASEYASAVALVVPSTSSSEGYSDVAVEAIRYGCPVVISATVPAADDLVPLGCALAYPSKDTGDLASALLRVWTDSGLRTSLTEKAVSASASFSWSVLLPQMVAPALVLLRA